MNRTSTKISILLTIASTLMIGHAAAEVLKEPTATSGKPVNICYERLSSAYLSLNAEKMVDVYTDDGHYISAGKDKEIIKGKEQLSSLYISYFKRLQKHNSSLDLQFRVTNRLLDTKSISDIGYYVVTIIPPL